MALVLTFVTFMNTVHFLSKLSLIFVASALTYVLPLLCCGLMQWITTILHTICSYISGCERKELRVMVNRHLLGGTDQTPD